MPEPIIEAGKRLTLSSHFVFSELRRKIVFANRHEFERACRVSVNFLASVPTKPKQGCRHVSVLVHCNDPLVG